LEVVVSCLYQRSCKIAVYLMDVYSYTIEEVPELKCGTIVSIEVLVGVVSEVVVECLL
jgi:hypothetical protein